jgi:hypothetical protein
MPPPRRALSLPSPRAARARRLLAAPARVNGRLIRQSTQRGRGGKEGPVLRARAGGRGRSRRKERGTSVSAPKERVGARLASPWLAIRRAPSVSRGDKVPHTRAARTSAMREMGPPREEERFGTPPCCLAHSSASPGRADAGGARSMAPRVGLRTRSIYPMRADWGRRDGRAGEKKLRGCVGVCLGGVGRAFGLSGAGALECVRSVSLSQSGNEIRRRMSVTIARWQAL